MSCGIFLDQESKPCPLHWQADSTTRPPGKPPWKLLAVHCLLQSLFKPFGEPGNSLVPLWAARLRVQGSEVGLEEARDPCCPRCAPAAPGSGSVPLTFLPVVRRHLTASFISSFPSTAAVPNLRGTRDWFCGREFSHGQGGDGGGSGGNEAGGRWVPGKHWRFTPCGLKLQVENSRTI